MYKEDFALNNLQWLICHNTKPNIRKGINPSVLPTLLRLRVNSKASWVCLGEETSLGEGKFCIQTSCTLLKN